jgi:lysophospholipase L1-like esterase
MKKNILLTVVSVLIALGAMEAALWVVAPPPRAYTLPKGLLARSPHGWILKPGLTGFMDNRRDYRNKRVTVDGRGLRITPASRRVAGGGPRIHLLGDSQTFGHGLADEETWANRLQDRLLARGFRNVRVENYGVPAINVDQYYVRSKAVVPAMRPGDIVLVGLSWNDLMTPQSREWVSRIVDGYLVTVPAPANTPAPARGKGDEDGGEKAKNEEKKAGKVEKPAPDVQAAVRWRLRFYEWTGIAIPRLRALKPFLEALSMNSALASFLLPHIRGIYFRLRSDNNPFLPFIRDKVPESNFLILFDIKRRVEARGGRFAVVLMASRFFVEDSVYRIYSQGGRAFPERNYQGYIARPQCERFRITCFDTFDVLQKHNREGVIFPIDGHYNERGARLVGDFLARSIAPLLKPVSP